jgi:hypothetical protein
MTSVNPNQALHTVISPVLVGLVQSIIIVGVVPNPA